MATEAPAPEAPSAEPQKKGFKFPTAFTVLFFVLLLVWALSFIIKPGSYQYVSCGGENPQPIAGSYQPVEVEATFKDRLYDLWLSPVNGLYGIQETAAPLEGADLQDAENRQIPVKQADGSTTNETVATAAAAACGEQPSDYDEEADGPFVTLTSAPGGISAYNEGSLFGAVAVFFFVLAIGAFITVTLKTGALDAGIGRLTHRYRERGLVLIIVLMAVFSLGGTTYGMAEETLGFYALIVPIMVGLGFDRVVGAATILLGAGIGTLASTVNPFATGVASDAADIALGDGLIWRLIMYLVLTPVVILYVIRYARKVKRDPSKSLVPRTADDEQLMAEEANPPAMTGRQKLVLWIFGLTFLIMIFSVIPWGDLFAESDFAATISLGWYFPELAALFLVGAIVIGLIGRLGEEGMVNGIIAGMGDFMGAAFIIAVARGVTVIMNNSSITDTVLNSLEGAVSNLSSVLFSIMMFVVNIPLAFLVPSSSGHATLAMPIMAPLADFAGVSRAIVVTAYQSASGWVNLFTPTSAIVMGGLTLAKVGYDKYIRFVWPLLAILFVLVSILLALGTFVPALSGSVN